MLEAQAHAEAEWVGTLRQLARRGERFYNECTPGYYNNEGKPDLKNGFITNFYGGGPVEFFKILRDWRAEGTLRGLSKS